MNRKSSDPGKTRPPAAADGELFRKELTHQAIGAAMRVHRELGPGFPEPIYREAMKIDLKASGIRVGLLMNFGEPSLRYERFVY